MLSEDIEETIKFPNNVCSEHQIDHISEYFEEISYKLQDYEFVNIIEQLQNKYIKLVPQLQSSI